MRCLAEKGTVDAHSAWRIIYLKIVRKKEERKKLLIKFGRCFKCINKGHRARDCKASVQCENCKGSHNTCLCELGSQQTPAGDSGQPLVNSPSSLLVETESRIALQTAQALLRGMYRGG